MILLTPNIATLILSAASADVRRIIMDDITAKTSCNNHNIAKLITTMAYES